MIRFRSLLVLLLPLLLILSPTSILAGDAKQAKPARPHFVPYRLTDTLHMMVRAKINGKGPFNFIVDTGAPALFVSTSVCKTLGINPDKAGWGIFDRFEVEGGAVINKARGRIEDPFQLEGMNGLGLAGVKLHGIIGYNILARYRIEIDFTRDKLVWTRLRGFNPPPPQGLGGDGGGSGAAGLNAIGSAMKMLGSLLGTKTKPQTKMRGFLGIELLDRDGAVLVKKVLLASPAAVAGVEAEDKIAQFQGQEVDSVANLERQFKTVPAGQTVELVVLRGQEKKTFTLKAGAGL